MESRKHRFLLLALALALLSGCARQQSDPPEKTRAMILHITKQTEWEAAVSAGEYSAASLHDQGFIHCTTPDQAVSIANALFAGQNGLVLLCIDEERLDAEVRYENLEGGDELFPHVYGNINLNAVTDVIEFEPETDGRFRLPIAIQKKSNGIG